MKFSVLASGSTGNSTFIETLTTKILIDIGMSSLYIEKKLRSIDVDPSTINAIIITHTHIDHVSGLRVFIKKYHPIVFITRKMYPDLKEFLYDNEFEFIDDKIYLGDMTITKFSVSHDAPDTNGYLVESNESSIVYVTDTGYLNNRHFELLKNKNAYIFESNHDIKMLMDGKYQYHLKQRILSDRGHLSNKDSAYYLSQIIGSSTKKVILAHLSKENNTEEKAIESFNEMIKQTQYRIEPIVAQPNERTELMTV